MKSNNHDDDIRQRSRFHVGEIELIRSMLLKYVVNWEVCLAIYTRTEMRETEGEEEKTGGERKKRNVGKHCIFFLFIEACTNFFCDKWERERETWWQNEIDCCMILNVGVTRFVLINGKSHKLSWVLEKTEAFNRIDWSISSLCLHQSCKTCSINENQWSMINSRLIRVRHRVWFIFWQRSISSAVEKSKSTWNSDRRAKRLVIETLQHHQCLFDVDMRQICFSLQNFDDLQEVIVVDWMIQVCYD